jgi:hypothetical protein
VETEGPLTYLGRFDSEDERGVHLLDVGVHDASAGGSRSEYVERSTKFGIKVDRKHLVVPRREVAKITRLGTMDP